MTPEGEVKQHLRARVAKLMGEIRFMKWIGRNHAQDCFVMLPPGTQLNGYVHVDGPILVETKARGKRLRPGQERETNRMRRYGVRVLVCPTKEDVDREFPAP